MDQLTTKMTEKICLGCLYITESRVTLRDGRVVCSSCDLWRHETEVNHVLAIESVEGRRSYLAGIEKKRGPEALKRLGDDVRTEWKRRRECEGKN